jgi:PAS domain S-box-containing protein
MVVDGPNQCHPPAGTGAPFFLLENMLSSDLVRRVLDSAPDAMIIIDRSGDIVFANQQVEALFGYPAAELVGRKVELLLPERYRARHVDHRNGYISNVRVRPMGSGLDLFARRRDGTEFPVEISLSPASDGDEMLAVAAIRDITERREIQNALREARETADRANQAKSRFLATASHDLRQPLQALSLLNGALRRMIKEETAADALLQQEQAISAMSRLLNALLDISKLESGAIKPELTDFRVSALASEMRAEFAAFAASKGLGLEVQVGDECVHSDAALVGQVLRNLITNAIKYTEQGAVTLRSTRESGGVRLQVVDTGVGIPAVELARIYDDFYQIGVSPNTSRDGYGLGLSIVSRIVVLLGLKLEVQSEVDRGTVFSLVLPASERRSDAHTLAPASISSSTAVDGARMPVLLVEDDARVRNASRMFLKAEGFDVVATSSFDEALAAVQSRKDFRLLITDYHLGRGQTGVQVIEAVRQKLGRPLPAILVTGDTSSAMRELRADAFLRTASKPINPDELLKLVRDLSPGD